MRAIGLGLFSFCLISAAIVVHANDDANTNLQNDPRFDARISELLAKNVLQLSQEIGTAILQDSDRSSEVISPVSIYMALSILLMGSNGPTFYELMNLLKISNGKLCSTTSSHNSANFHHFIPINSLVFFRFRFVATHMESS